MCYSTRQTKKTSELKKIFDAIPLEENQEELDLIYFHANGWSHPIMWMIPQEDPNKLVAAQWGIMPANERQQDFQEYFKNHPKAFGGLNAQSEKLFGYYAQRYQPMHKRCVIPIDGFFEPHNTHVKVNGKDFKVPFYFHRKDNDPICLAGIYSTNADGRNTFTVLTRQAMPEEDSLFYKIHNKEPKTERRRPVILKDEDVDSWLHQGNSAADVLQIIQDDLWEGELEAYPVSRDLYSRSIDSNFPEIIERVAYSEVQL
ncbi:SOS response-associated peptidase [Allomuricauda sp. NBRC 101325]|uniref:SOS response-associated peptidase n=1 Tax=Allomuricauda sp. NBRC 101325 TaxID=1113758 RepID=UPI0024A430E2|nr:SOS response-associated peptidase family protein [Muricauda sp. NBRC 101325]GLU44744.1 DUF159 family protein [Muricauda sp. NBRC 101325]